MMGINHHFLLLLRKSHSSLKKPGERRIDWTSKSLGPFSLPTFGSAILRIPLELAKIPAYVRLWRARAPIGVCFQVEPSLKGITTEQSHHDRQGGYHSIVHEGQEDVGNQPSDRPGD